MIHVITFSRWPNIQLNLDFGSEFFDLTKFFRGGHMKQLKQVVTVSVFAAACALSAQNPAYAEAAAEKAAIARDAGVPAGSR